MEEITIAGKIADSVDFSMLSLFLREDFVVKSVIVILIISSLYSWNIIIAKLLRLRQLKQMDKEFEDIFWSGNSFEDLYETLNFNKLDPSLKENIITEHQINLGENKSNSFDLSDYLFLLEAD